MKTKNLVIATVLSVAAVPPAIADMVTFKSTGVIDNSAEYSFNEDGIGLFGPAGGSLLGAKFTLTTSFDTDKNRSNGVYEWYASSSGSAPLDIVITINGRTHSYHVRTDAYLNATVYGALSAIGRGSDDLRFYGGGIDSAGWYVGAAHNAMSYSIPFMGPTANFGTKAYLDAKMADYKSSGFSVRGADGIYTRFQSFNLASMEINPSPVDVPEPSTLALLAAAALSFLLATPNLLWKASNYD